MSKEEVIQQVSTIGLREYGVYNDYLADSWNTILRKHDLEQFPIKLAVALNNNDNRKVLLQLLKKEPLKVMEGMLIAAYILDAEDILLYLPENEVELQAELDKTARDMGITICCNDFVDRRLLTEYTLHHIETMAFLAEAFSEDYRPGVYVAVEKKGILHELCRIPYGTKISEIIGSDREDIKGIEINSKLYDEKAADFVLDSTISLGNGVITILDKSTCIINEAEKRLYVSRSMGCGKCTFCREGLLQLQGMIKDITKGKGKNEYLPLLQEIGEAVSYSTLCSVGQTGSDFVLGSLSYFSSEYEEHIKKKKCLSGVCTAFVPIYIDPELCIGCEECVDVCPADCIEGKAGFIHMIDEFDCTKCGKCMEACDSDAIIKTSGKVPKLPDRLTKCGKFKKR